MLPLCPQRRVAEGGQGDYGVDKPQKFVIY
jgi:hypothetical protein